LSPFRMSSSSTTPATTLNNYNSGDTAGSKRREILQGLLDIAYPQAMSNAYGDVLDRSMQLSIGINNEIAALSVAGSIYAAFNTAVNAIPNSSIGQQLRQVARMIAVSRFGQGAIQANRQVFYVSTGGYDTHSGQINGTRPNGSGVWAGHQGLLQQVAQAMKGFNDALNVLNQVSGYTGVKDEVMTFTNSEFSRTINSNGAGTDHAWGAVQMVMGPVTAAQVYGRYPLQLLNRSFGAGGPDQWGECFNRGEFLPSIAVDQVAATLARWMGVGDADLPIIFPNLDTFAGAHANQSVMAYNTRTLPFL